ncbi:MAG: isoaspartyl peptidase/L-asparaginase family protein [Salinivirgaceae bacterium]
MANRLQFKHVKPYLFILGFLLVPLLLVPFVRNLKNSSSFYSKESVIHLADTVKSAKYGLVIHGGAGNFLPEDIPSEQQAQYKAKLHEALALGISSLDKGDSALKVVIQVIKVLEDSPLFNAGKGAVFTHDGTNELDASIMDGNTKNAGAVAGVQTIKNPITAAYQVMVSSNHVLLTGKGAEAFAKEKDIELVDPGYFYTEKQWNRLQQSLSDKKMGTVGCVVLDAYGNLAAGTSTGGMTNKRYGRVGDSPIIGAGTYADNASCAISATGHGEFFIRFTVAYDIAARMKYLKLPLELASKSVISELKQVGGEGGIIGIDKKGNISMQFNTTGMFRGYCLHNNDPKVLLFN